MQKLTSSWSCRLDLLLSVSGQDAHLPAVRASGKSSINGFSCFRATGMHLTAWTMIWDQSLKSEGLSSGCYCYGEVMVTAVRYGGKTLPKVGGKEGELLEGELSGVQ